MKTMKRIMALLICFVMVMGMTVTAFAANDTTYSVTIKKDSSDNASHTYEAYQIFKGDLSTDGKLSNITWGSSIDKNNLSGLVSKINELASVSLTTSSSASDFADAMTKITDKSENANELAIAIKGAIKTSDSGAVVSSNNVISGLTAGYYLIKDKDDSLDKANGAYTRYILQVVKTITVNEKASVPSVVKKVKDVNDSEGTESNWQDSADYDIGDEVPFQLTATTASTVSDYKTYHVTFEDTQSAGLEKPASFKITVLNKELTLSNEDNALVTATTNNGTDIKAEIIHADTECTFAIKVTLTDKDGNKINSEANSKTIEVTYNSVLSSSAKIGAEGNPNEVYLKYSNNPNVTDDSKEGKTPTDKVIVFTYEAIVNKVDGDNQPLTGAEFTLYKKASSTISGTTKTGAEIIAGLTSKDSSIDTSGLDKDANYIVKTMVVDAINGAKFTLKGIDDGEYVLVETKIPEGYNAFVSKAFNITATHSEDDSDPKLLTLTQTENVLGSVDKDAGTLTGTIANKAGSTLPSTGGIGTRIFYIIGGILMAAAAVVLITKVRYKKEK